MANPQPSYGLTLFVTGAGPRSARAVANVRAFCDRELPEDYALEVVDLYQSPERAREDSIVAAPTLLRYSPVPPRRLIGDMTDRMRMATVIKVPVDGG